MYRIETHMHCCHSSSCSRLDEVQIVEGCLAAGYHGVVITDHFHENTAWYCYSRKPHLGDFLVGYERVLREGQRQGLQVYRGAEVRFSADPNDYLVYGYPDALLANPEKVFSMGLADFSKAARDVGALVIQAHPFRRGPYEICHLANVEMLDGIEVFNGNTGVDNRNDEAMKAATRHPELLWMSGSDSHHAHQIGVGGVVLPMLPENEKQLVTMLKTRNYELSMP